MKTVIVIDDDADIREMVGVFLTRRGFRVIPAENGKVGIDLFDGEPAVDFVVTDLEMPVVDGRGVARHVRASKLDGTRIIAMTGSQYPIPKGLFDHIIRKPFSLKGLADYMSGIQEEKMLEA